MRDGAATKKKIERAALSLFVRQGVAQTSIKEIALEANVSQGAMYTYYKSKDDLAWELFARDFSDIGHSLWAIVVACVGGVLARWLNRVGKRQSDEDKA